MTDAARRLRVATPVMFALFAIAGVTGMGTYGWQPPLAAGAAGVVYVLTWARNTPRRHRPEYAYAFAFVFAEAMFAASAGLASGPRGYGYVMLIMPVLPLAVAFPRRVVAAGSALAVGLMLAVTFGVDLAELRAAPPVAWCAPLVLLGLAVTVLVVRDVDDAARRSAFVDDLTGALNRSALRPRLSELRHQAEASGAPVGVIVGDIDHFKAINDRHGHVAGDAVLRGIARCLSDCVSAFDPVYRLGGEEFVILLPGRDTEATYDMARRMVQAVRSRPLDGVMATMSFGVASSVAGQPFDFDAAFERADAALYAAKQGGRDCVSATREVELADPDPQQRRAAILAARGRAPAVGAGGGARRDRTGAAASSLARRSGHERSDARYRRGVGRRHAGDREARARAHPGGEPAADPAVPRPQRRGVRGDRRRDSVVRLAHPHRPGARRDPGCAGGGVLKPPAPPRRLARGRMAPVPDLDRDRLPVRARRAAVRAVAVRADDARSERHAPGSRGRVRHRVHRAVDDRGGTDPRPRGGLSQPRDPALPAGLAR